jgi:hypothetical protein
MCAFSLQSSIGIRGEVGNWGAIQFQKPFTEPRPSWGGEQLPLTLS